MRKLKQHISALIDGELDGPDAARTVRAALASPAGRACWLRYQLIGAALRAAAETDAPDVGLAQTRRLVRRLDAEPALVAGGATADPPDPHSAADPAVKAGAGGAIPE